jgi:hypothetical protein
MITPATRAPPALVTATPAPIRARNAEGTIIRSLSYQPSGPGVCDLSFVTADHSMAPMINAPQICGIGALSPRTTVATIRTTTATPNAVSHLMATRGFSNTSRDSGTAPFEEVVNGTGYVSPVDVEPVGFARRRQFWPADPDPTAAVIRVIRGPSGAGQAATFWGTIWLDSSGNGTTTRARW